MPEMLMIDSDEVGGSSMRRTCSLPQLICTALAEEPRPASHQNQSKRGQPTSTKQSYRGRFSLSKAQRGGKSQDESGQSHVRTRNSSGLGRGDRSSRHENHSFCDEVYQCLLPELRSHSSADAVSPPTPISSTVMRRELAKSAGDRNEFHRNLQRMICANAMAKLSRLSEKATLGSVRKSSQQMFLISRRNERFKWGDVLWLQLQAAVAGRQMKPPSAQIQSTREHDQYLMAEREKQKAVLGEIHNFHFNDCNDSGSSSPVSPACGPANQDFIKAKLKVVRDLLDRYEDFVALYPNISCMQRSANVNDLVRTRIQILYAWYNITMDLYARIREVGVILGMYRDVNSIRRVSLSPNITSKDSDGHHPLTVLSWPTLDSPDEMRGSVTSSRNSSDLSFTSSTPQCTLTASPMVMNTSTELTAALLEQPHNIYTAFVSRSLRRKGMRKVLQRLDSVCAKTVEKVVVMLQKSPESYAEAVDGGRRLHSVDYNMTLTPECYANERTKLDEKQKRDLPRNLANHKEFLAMKLPSFQNLFLFLVRVPVDLVHEWLKMRISAQLPADLLTLQTVMEDCHDCIEAAIAVKHKFVSLVQLAGVDNKVLINCLAPFEDDLGEVFKSYLKCVRDWAREEVDIEGVGAEWTERVIQNLTSEWTMAKRFAVNVIGGESETVHRFCVIAGDLMRKMVNDYLPEKENMMEECRSNFEVASPDSLRQLEDSSLRRHSSQIFVACRHFKSLICQMKDRSLRTLAFARMLLMDIEICAFYKFKCTNMRTHLYQLLVSQHSMVIISNNIANVDNNYVIFCDKNASEKIDFVRILLNITCSRYRAELPKALAECTGYLLIIPLRTHFSNFCQEMWRGTRLAVELDADTELSLRYLQLPGDACIVAVNGTSLPKMRELFARNMTLGHESMFEILEEQASCHDIVIECAKQLKKSASRTCQLLFDEFAGKMVKDVLDGRYLASLDLNELESVRATLIQAYNLAFEYHREFFRILSRSDHRLFACQTVRWAEKWRHFASQFVISGDGSVPLWAIHSFQFLILAADPQLSEQLTSGEFQELVKTVDDCVAHVVGSSTPDSGMVNGAFFDCKADDSMCMHCLSNSKPYSTADGIARAQRIQGLLREIDSNRNRNLEVENKIGRVRDGGRGALSLSAFFSPKKHAPFEWQRLEKKIGSGKFGTVYVVMNLTDKCLMAMKQIRIERNDKALLALVDEVENLRSLDHPNLVKYYAVEVHREELLIFMEYCSEGTLEEVCREGLLDMRCVRRYTHFLLKGVEYIHNKMIIHRDIKPANIFLGKKDVLKLGDFGSSVRLRGVTTACGEVAEWVGTPAYMAPEVQTLGGRSETGGREELIGYGRAADIWSVGCVVLEMCTGKPPWHECEQVLQIVFRVGSGMRPTIPQSLQADTTCYSFLDHCFQTEPVRRATVEQLRQHPFANINVDESCDSRRSNFY